MNDELKGPAPMSLEITVSGRLAATVLDILEDRYDGVTASHSSEKATVLRVAAVDQAGERAVLALLWDTGHRVRSVEWGES